MVGIDFGYHFEIATQFLPCPELVPMRMTPLIVNVSEPLRTAGLLRETMMSCLQTLVEDKKRLMAAVAAFIKQPTQEWVKFAKIRPQKTPAASNDQSVVEFSRQRVEVFAKKLDGINPCVVLEWALEKNYRVNDKDKKLLTGVLYGKGSDRMRTTISKYGLTVPQQVDVLLDVATDPNILGRTF